MITTIFSRFRRRRLHRRCIPFFSFPLLLLSLFSSCPSSTFSPFFRRRSSPATGRFAHPSPHSTDIMGKKDREVGMDEPTMAEKLESLDLLNDKKLENTSIPDPSITVEPPRADSLHILLKQALHAEDHSLLMDCLYTRDQKVITKSIALLNPAGVAKLLKCLLLMAESRGAVMLCALPWLRTLLCQQASSIILQESSLAVLNSLYHLIESRVSTFGSAMQLSSCIDNLFYEIADDETDDGDVHQPIIYENSDESDDEESDDAMETDSPGDGEGPGDVTDADDSDHSDLMSV